MNLDMNKYDFMLERNANYMNYIALSFGERNISYEEMHDRIEKYYKLLKLKGITKGDIVGVCLLNCPESVYLLYALDKIGAVVVGFNPFEDKEKTKKDIELTNPKAVITVDMAYSNFKDYEKALDFSIYTYSPVKSVNDLKFKLLYNVLQIKNGNFCLFKNINREIEKMSQSSFGLAKSPYKSDDVSDILFTGGTTGVHKGVELTSSGLNYVVEGMNSIFDAYPGMIHLGNIPISHMAYGRVILHYALCNNMELALTLKALPKDFYSELVRTHANAAVGGPPHWVSLISEKDGAYVPDDKLIPSSLSELHYATSGGEAKKSSTDAAINAALKYCGSDAKIGDGLGATETWATMFANNGKKHTAGTVGVPISTIDVKLISPITGKEVADGEKGLLCVSGPSVMLRYHNNSKETDKVIFYDDNGKKWCNLGDYLVKLENGEYKYVGRQKRNFVSGIENIYPEELENLILSMPEVKEVLVTPVSDDLVQFIPRYHIYLTNQNIDYEDFEKRLNALVLKNLTSSWLPGTIDYLNEPLKRMSNSKVDINYYLEKDKEELNQGLINNTSGRKLRLQKI